MRAVASRRRSRTAFSDLAGSASPNRLSDSTSSATCGPGQPDELVPALRLGAHQPSGLQPRRRARWPPACRPPPVRELGDRPPPAVEHRQAHRRPALVAEQAGGRGDRAGVGHAGAPSGTRALGFRRASATPTRASTPPTYAIAGGASDSSTQLSSTVIGGTR